MEKDPGQKLIEVDRLSRRHTYVTDGGIKIYRDPIFNEEKRLLQERISRENKKIMAKELGVTVKNLNSAIKKIKVT